MLAVVASVMLSGLDGGPLLADDFEINALVKPAGRWDTLVLSGIQVPLLRDSAAAHRGDAGLTLSRVADGGVFGSYGTWLELTLSPPVDAGLLTVRAWVRERQTNNVSGIIFAQLPATNVPTTVAAEVGFNHSATDQWHLQGYDCSAAPQSVVTSDGFDGGWHLAELVLDGIGTMAGSRTLIIDGIQVAQATPLDLHNALLTAVRLGDVYLYYAVGDTLDLDDVRVDTDLQPDRIWAVMSATVAGVCMPGFAELADYQYNTRPAPYALTANIAPTPGLDIYGAPNCSGPPLTQLSFSAGDVARPIWIQAVQGTFTVTLSHPDFVSVPSIIGIGADAGALVMSDGGVDAGQLDAGFDGGVPDAGQPDAGQPDAGQPDAGVDAGSDGGSLAPDAGVDAGTDGGALAPDAGPLAPRNDRVDCGCSASPALLPLLALFALRRRRQLKS